jgi:hypothetical protein
MRRWLVVGGCLFAFSPCAHANAQSIELLSVPFTPTTSRADTGLTAVRVRTFIGTLHVPLPALFGSDNFRLVPEISLVHFRGDYRAWDTGRLGPEPPSSATRGVLDLSAERNFGSRFTFLATVSGTSDLITLDAFAMVLRAGWPWSWGVGGARSLQFGAEVPIPVLYLKYADQVANTVELLAPAYAEYWHRPGEHLALGFQARLISWRFSRDNRVEYTLFRLGPAARWYFAPGLAVQWEGGVTVGQVFNQISNGRVTRKIAPADRVFFQVGIRADAPWWLRR